ncbi:MAG: hypothetical protein AAF488_17305 [Planctomycetota bacterium]
MSEAQSPQVPSASPSNSSQSSSPLRMGALVIGGALAVYFASMAGPAAFESSFQARFLEGGDLHVPDGVVWGTPQAAAAEFEPWGFEKFDALLLPRPPGEFVKSTSEPSLKILEYKEGSIRYELLSRGFLQATLDEQTRRLGGTVPDSRSDLDCLREIVRETPAAYSSSMPSSERAEYSARLLCKMLLWEDDPIRRFEFAESEAKDAISVLVEYQSGRLKVVVAESRGTMVVVLPQDVPEAWRSSQARHWFPAMGEVRDSNTEESPNSEATETRPGE